MRSGVADYEIRPARPDDHAAIIAVVDAWFGRPVAAALPRLYLDHFFATSLIAEVRTPAGAPGAGNTGGDLAGFLVGFGSPSRPDEAYIHFSGVDPAHRGLGLGRRLYGRFIDAARQDRRALIRAITSPGNQASIAFHRRLGFTASDPVDGYDRPGVARVVLRLDLHGGAP